jgi:hypothetical protein
VIPNQATDGDSDYRDATLDVHGLYVTDLYATELIPQPNNTHHDKQT